MENLKLEISDLPPQFVGLAQELGVDKLLTIFKEFGGGSMYFPTLKMLYKEARDRKIREDFNGFNIKELSVKYSMSESHIRAIVRTIKKATL